MPTSSAKGNPASHRMSNAAYKARRAAAWLRGQKRKEANRAAQNERTSENKRRRANGEPTPWEKAKAQRASNRRGSRV